ncbi:EF-hand calcium-binding domain-containing protein 3-like [Hypomesus transpacificus]|uniref:EF-hand calcium-binding domain-containing protein 3-like n=1 Tax=Hypomesus transpacificus TaxID=137520 RepID=UPI001F08052D|nr:EF-hand calcium-binding domain-containing protein 3-like [Hypomesus transpacificus]
MMGAYNSKRQASRQKTDPKTRMKHRDSGKLHEFENAQDFSDVLHSLCIGQMKDLATMAPDETLSDAQVEAFRAAFDLFATSSRGIINAEGLSSLLETVDMKLSPSETETCLHRADYDGDGKVGFQDFLSLMTDSQKFATCMKVEPPPDLSQVVVVIDTVFYNALDKMLNAGLIPSIATGEIIRYYHKKSLHHIWCAAPQVFEDRGHVLTYYAKGAHLIGLQPKQLMKHILPYAPSTSPYSKRPSLNVSLSNTVVGKKVIKKPPPAATDSLSAKTRNDVEIEEHIRQLSFQHPGTETKDLITPVKVKIELQMKNRKCLTYNEINEIKYKCKNGLNSFLDTLTHYKQRDAWKSWGSLQVYHRALGFKAFPDTFSTYTWSWSGCRNMLQPQDLQERWNMPLPLTTLN